MSRPGNVHIQIVPPVDHMIDTFLADIGFGFNPGEMRRRLRRDALKLNAMSDPQLALFGIARAEIPAYVFRRIFPDFAPPSYRAV